MSTTPQPIGNMSLIGRTKEVLSTKLGFVMATEMENIKKRHPRKDVSVNLLRFNKLLIKCSSNVNGASNCTTYHRVVTDAEESHHLNVCWN